MPSQPAPPAASHDQRRFPRRRVPAMYSLLRMRADHEALFCWTGHIYDLSMGGMRFELDQPLTPGTEVDLRAMLPGAEHVTIHASGRVVRLHNDEDDDRGPTRMGLTFEGFKSQYDYQRLEAYLTSRGADANESRAEAEAGTYLINPGPASPASSARAA